MGGGLLRGRGFFVYSWLYVVYKVCLGDYKLFECIYEFYVYC